MAPRAILLRTMAVLLASVQVAARPVEWRQRATPRDLQRIEHVDSVWKAAAREGIAAGGQDFGRLGPVVLPGSALPKARPEPGIYRCRIIKLGSQAGAPERSMAYGFFQCRITTVPGGLLRLAKLTGSQRPVGLLFPLSSRRLAFLGTLSLGQETARREYGHDAALDMAGVLERVGPGHYRLVLPEPAFESRTDILELIGPRSAVVR